MGNGELRSTRAESNHEKRSSSRRKERRRSELIKSNTKFGIGDCLDQSLGLPTTTSPARNVVRRHSGAGLGYVVPMVVSASPIQKRSLHKIANVQTNEFSESRHNIKMLESQAMPFLDEPNKGLPFEIVIGGSKKKPSSRGPSPKRSTEGRNKHHRRVSESHLFVPPKALCASMDDEIEQPPPLTEALLTSEYKQVSSIGMIDPVDMLEEQQAQHQPPEMAAQITRSTPQRSKSRSSPKPSKSFKAPPQFSIPKSVKLELDKSQHRIIAPVDQSKEKKNIPHRSKSNEFEFYPTATSIPSPVEKKSALKSKSRIRSSTANGSMGLDKSHHTFVAPLMWTRNESKSSKLPNRSKSNDLELVMPALLESSEIRKQPTRSKSATTDYDFRPPLPLERSHKLLQMETDNPLSSPKIRLRLQRKRAGTDVDIVPEGMELMDHDIHLEGKVMPPVQAQQVKQVNNENVQSRSITRSSPSGRHRPSASDADIVVEELEFMEQNTLGLASKVPQQTLEAAEEYPRVQKEQRTGKENAVEALEQTMISIPDIAVPIISQESSENRQSVEKSKKSQGLNPPSGAKTRNENVKLATAKSQQCQQPTTQLQPHETQDVTPSKAKANTNDFVINPSREDLKLMRQVSALDLVDPVYGKIHESTRLVHPSNIFEDMDYADVPKDMQDILSVASDRTDDAMFSKDVLQAAGMVESNEALVSTNDAKGSASNPSALPTNDVVARRPSHQEITVVSTDNIALVEEGPDETVSKKFVPPTGTFSKRKGGPIGRSVSMSSPKPSESITSRRDNDKSKFGKNSELTASSEHSPNHTKTLPKAAHVISDAREGFSKCKSRSTASESKEITCTVVSKTSELPKQQNGTSKDHNAHTTENESDNVKVVTSFIAERAQQPNTNLAENANTNAKERTVSRKPRTRAKLLKEINQAAGVELKGIENTDGNSKSNDKKASLKGSTREKSGDTRSKAKLIRASSSEPLPELNHNPQTAAGTPLTHSKIGSTKSTVDESANTKARNRNTFLDEINRLNEIRKAEMTDPNPKSPGKKMKRKNASAEHTKTNPADPPATLETGFAGSSVTSKVANELSTEESTDIGIVSSQSPSSSNNNGSRRIEDSADTETATSKIIPRDDKAPSGEPTKSFRTWNDNFATNSKPNRRASLADIGIGKTTQSTNVENRSLAARSASQATMGETSARSSAGSTSAPKQRRKKSSLNSIGIGKKTESGNLESASLTSKSLSRHSKATMGDTTHTRSTTSSGSSSKSRGKKQSVAKVEQERKLDASSPEEDFGITPPWPSQPIFSAATPKTVVRKERCDAWPDQAPPSDSGKVKAKPRAKGDLFNDIETKAQAGQSLNNLFPKDVFGNLSIVNVKTNSGYPNSAAVQEDKGDASTTVTPELKEARFASYSFVVPTCKERQISRKCLNESSRAFDKSLLHDIATAAKTRSSLTETGLMTKPRIKNALMSDIRMSAKNKRPVAKTGAMIKPRIKNALMTDIRMTVKARPAITSNALATKPRIMNALLSDIRAAKARPRLTVKESGTNVETNTQENLTQAGNAACPDNPLVNGTSASKQGKENLPEDTKSGVAGVAEAPGKAAKRISTMEALMSSWDGGDSFFNLPVDLETTAAGGKGSRWNRTSIGFAWSRPDELSSTGFGLNRSNGMLELKPTPEESNVDAGSKEANDSVPRRRPLKRRSSCPALNKHFDPFANEEVGHSEGGASGEKLVKGKFDVDSPPTPGILPKPPDANHARRRRGKRPVLDKDAKSMRKNDIASATMRLTDPPLKSNPQVDSLWESLCRFIPDEVKQEPSLLDVPCQPIPENSSHSIVEEVKSSN